MEGNEDHVDQEQPLLGLEQEDDKVSEGEGETLDTVFQGLFIVGKDGIATNGSEKTPNPTSYTPGGSRQGR
jgi:hypothetical protein